MAVATSEHTEPDPPETVPLEPLEPDFPTTDVPTVEPDPDFVVTLGADLLNAYEALTTPTTDD